MITFVRFGLFVTGEGEEKFLPELFAPFIRTRLTAANSRSSRGLARRGHEARNASSLWRVAES
jgi:hypothetical protein